MKSADTSKSLDQKEGSKFLLSDLNLFRGRYLKSWWVLRGEIN